MLRFGLARTVRGDFTGFTCEVVLNNTGIEVTELSRDGLFDEPVCDQGIFGE